ncbi:hypothetical protein BCR42DRAFT_427179 [Absidia repens]|uniref:Uncharacterized protein n=1 Tax=Absidia repens TaxID=90262 RepID=A0A1X2I040_9FUNG|nr:hypothetical protein BCR42DRAFT_427179 [Absidia repens]
MLFKFLFALAIMVCLVNNVSAGTCCGAFDGSCCGRCTSGSEIGQECTKWGNPHDVMCGRSYCPDYDLEGCDAGWKC